MDTIIKTQIIDLIHREVIPAIGCTEPIAVALAAAKAAEVLGRKPEKIEVYLSANILKNAMGVGIPGTGMVGLPIAIALGSIIGKSAYGLEVLKDLTSEGLKEGKEMVCKKCIGIDLKENVDKLYIEIISSAGNDRSRVIICHEHTHIIYVEKNGEVLTDLRTANASGEEVCENKDLRLSFSMVYEFAMEMPLDEIRFILETAELNKKAAQASMKGNYGHTVSKTVSGAFGRKFMGDSAYTHMLIMTSAACDARMDGAMIPVMSNSGSGNQGIAATLPVLSFAEDILAQLGITPSSAIQMLYRQIVLTRGLPLDLHLPPAAPTAVGGMSRTELDTELQKGVASLQNGKSFSVDEVDAALYQEFGI